VPTREFKLRFPEVEIPKWAGHYDAKEDEAILALVPAIKVRGWLGRDEFLAIVEWKSSRPLPLARRNSESDIERVTAIALSSECSEHVRVGAIQALMGVGVPVASVILHLCHDDVYPVFDYRAMWSLGYDREPACSVRFWLKYVEFFRGLCKRSGLDKRTVDRGLWGYSKENQPSQE